MKKISISLLMAITTLSFGQKKEISAAFKAIENNDVGTAASQITAAENIIKNNTYLLTPELQEQYLYTKGLVAIKQGKNAEGAEYLAQINKLKTSKIYTGKDQNKNKVYFVGKEAANASGIEGLKEESYSPKHIAALGNTLNPIIQKTNNEAVQAYNSKQYSLAASKFEETYNLLEAVGQKNGQLLYYSALAYVNAKENNNAIKVFKKLIDMKYNGVETIYTAKNKKTGQVETLDKATWELIKKTEDYTDFKTENTKNIEQDLYEIYATILIEENKNDEAIEFLNKAIEKYPANTKYGAIQGTAYYKAGKTDDFVKSLRNTLEKKPNDAVSWYNLGVILSNDEKQKTEAKQAFERAISIDPKMDSAYLNLGNLIIGNDEKVIEEYNALRKSGKSNEANKLLETRKQRFLQAITVLEKWHNISPNNIDAVTMLKGLYQSTKNEAKYNEMKAKEASLNK